MSPNIPHSPLASLPSFLSNECLHHRTHAINLIRSVGNQTETALGAGVDAKGSWMSGRSHQNEYFVTLLPCRHESSRSGCSQVPVNKHRLSLQPRFQAQKKLQGWILEEVTAAPHPISFLQRTVSPLNVGRLRGTSVHGWCTVGNANGTHHRQTAFGSFCMNHIRSTRRPAFHRVCPMLFKCRKHPSALWTSDSRICNKPTVFRNTHKYTKRRHG